MISWRHRDEGGILTLREVFRRVSISFCVRVDGHTVEDIETGEGYGDDTHSRGPTVIAVVGRYGQF